MPDEKIRLGIIGANVNYGWSMRAHLPAVPALPEYEKASSNARHPSPRLLPLIGMVKRIAHDLPG